MARDRNRAADRSEDDQRLDNSVELSVHHFKGAIQYGKLEPVGGHAGRIEALSLQNSQQALHPQSPSGTETGADGFLRHPDAPVQARNINEVALAVVSGVGNRTTRFGYLDRVLKWFGAAQCFNR